MTLFPRTTPFGAVHGTDETLVCAAAATLDQMETEVLEQMDGPRARIAELISAVTIDFQQLRLAS